MFNKPLIVRFGKSNRLWKVLGVHNENLFAIVGKKEILQTALAKPKLVPDYWMYDSFSATFEQCEKPSSEEFIDTNRAIKVLVSGIATGQVSAREMYQVLNLSVDMGFNIKTTFVGGYYFVSKDDPSESLTLEKVIRTLSQSR